MLNIIEFILNNQEYFEDFTTRATHHSNGIEGNTLSMAETYAIMFNKNDVKINTEPREFYEAINHKYALDYIFTHVECELKEIDIINIAKLVNKNINEIDGYRKTQVFIKGAEHIPPRGMEIPMLMKYFIDNYNNTVFDDIYEKVAYFHIEFERIHPFSDGNGRTGRVLMCLEFLKSNVAPAIVTKETKIEYINYIANRDVKGLTELLKKLSSAEEERMAIFKIANE